MRDKTNKKLFLGKVTISRLDAVQMDAARGGNTHTEDPNNCTTYSTYNSDILSCFSGELTECCI